MMRTSQWTDAEFVKGESKGTTWILELDVLTPIFGGGVESEGTKKPIDPRTPIRVSSIRGQLRFWWRATNAAGCNTVEDLRNAEARLFGAATLSNTDGDRKIGRVNLAVLTQPTDAARKTVDVFDGRSAHKGISYAAFALKATEGSTAHGSLTQITTRFSLRVSLRKDPELERQLSCAVWAWVNFGGIGGRTRRGFGAVHLTSASDAPSSVSLGLEAGWEHYGKAFGPRDWPTLPQDFDFAVAEKAARSNASGIEALNELLQKLQHLRQGDEVGRRRGQDPKRPGRSYWPEPDTVRQLRGKSDPKHREPVTRTGEFPRAAFGTPLIIQFGKAGERNNEPDSSTVNPTGLARLASPLVLRVARNATGQLSLRALRLDHPKPPNGFSLTWAERNRKDGKEERTVTVEVRDANFNLAGCKSPLIKNGVEFTDPIARFFEELKQ